MARRIHNKKRVSKQNKSSSGQIWNYMQKLPILAPKREICFAYSIVSTWEVNVKLASRITNEFIDKLEWFRL
jgi:hypothetical protein